MILSGVAIRAPGSPGRRPTISWRIGRPTASSQACEDLEHGHAGPRAEVVRPAHARLEGLDGELVRLGQVVGVDVVADAGPVAGVPVAAVDQELLAAADGHLEGQRDQVPLVRRSSPYWPSGSAPEALK